MLAGLRGKTTYETGFYGRLPWCDFRAEGITVQKETTAFRCLAPRGESVDVTLPLLGMHHVLDALAGLAVAERLGVPLDRAAAALGDYHPWPCASRFTMWARSPSSTILQHQSRRGQKQPERPFGAVPGRRRGSCAGGYARTGGVFPAGAF